MKLLKKKIQLKSWENEKLSNDEIKELNQNFVDSQKKRIENITKEINLLQNELFELKTKINKANVEKGIDIKLLKIKWMRIELLVYLILLIQLKIFLLLFLLLLRLQVC